MIYTLCVRETTRDYSRQNCTCFLYPPAVDQSLLSNKHDRAIQIICVNKNKDICSRSDDRVVVEVYFFDHSRFVPSYFTLTKGFIRQFSMNVTFTR